MKISDIIKESKNPVFSIEILPPLRGNSIYKVYDIIDRLKKYDPQFVNITSHHSEYIYKPLPDGTHKRVSVVKRPGTVAVATAIQNKYGLIPVPHIICSGFTKEETEYALLDLNFLGIDEFFKNAIISLTKYLRRTFYEKEIVSCSNIDYCNTATERYAIYNSKRCYKCSDYA